MPEPPDKILHKGRWIVLGIEAANDWEYASRPDLKGVVGILAVSKKREILLVEQYRPPLRRRTIELPAGLAGDDPYKRDEPLVAAAKRELYEETGYEADDWWTLCDGPSSPGMVDEFVTIFLATGLRKVADREVHGVDGEEIKLHRIALRNLPDFLKEKREDGVLIDFKVTASLYEAERHPMFPSGL